MGFDGVIVYKCGCIVDGYDIPAACPIHHVAGTYSDRKPKRGGQPMNLTRVLILLSTYGSSPRIKSHDFDAAIRILAAAQGLMEEQAIARLSANIPERLREIREEANQMDRTMDVFRVMDFYDDELDKLLAELDPEKEPE